MSNFSDGGRNQLKNDGFEIVHRRQAASGEYLELWRDPDGNEMMMLASETKWTIFIPDASEQKPGQVEAVTDGKKEEDGKKEGGKKES